MRKKIIAALLAASCVFSMSTSAFADYIVIGANGKETKYVSSGGVITSDTPLLPTAGTSTSSSSASSQGVGSLHAGDASVSLDLGFTVVSPNHDYYGYRVAEGSVQLSDGSWAEIGYNYYLDGGYYRLKEERVDSAGVPWYVVYCHGSNLGNYYTPDGSTATELWLKKSDCTATTSITLNTKNSVRQNIVRTALSLLGCQYSYGQTGPDAFDCSGFVNYCMSLNGISVSRTSTEICSNGTEVGISGLRPGDIVGRSGHVGIYIGNGLFVHSSETSTGVVCDSVEIYNSTSHPFTSYRNVVGD